MNVSGEPPCFLSQLPFDTATTVFLGLGTNMGERAANLAEAVRRLSALVHVEASSSVYASEPVGYTDQPEFWNMVVRCSTDLPARQLMSELIAIESAMGRRRTFRNAPRIIDIDILLYDDVSLANGELELPHPRMQQRAFVLRPLLEIAPDLVEPRTRERYADILQRQNLGRADVVGDLAILTGKGV